MNNDKEKIIDNIVMQMNLERKESNRLKNLLYMNLNDYSVIKISNTDIVVSEGDMSQEILKMFLVSKRVQGCTDRTIKYYASSLRLFFQFIQKPVTEVTTNDIRYFMAVKKERDKNSDCNINNYRRVLSSFYAWVTEEEYIQKNPMLKIKNVRQEKTVKKAFSDVEVERLRLEAAGNIRTMAILEVLLSTGCRVTEMHGMNIKDVAGDEIIVKGKGKKERIVYLNAKARIMLEQYLASRTDDNPALFVTMDKPHDRLKISGIEIVVRKLGRRAGVSDAHPHRFRRTAATMALNRGMPIDQVQQMLGHTNIETTTIYATSAQEVVKASHKRYVV